MFLMHIAMFFGFLVTAGGFVLWHWSVRERSASLRLGAWVLLLGGIFGLVCIIAYGYIYWSQGTFSTLMMHDMPAMMAR